MHKDMKIISLPLPFRMGTVNCYLIDSDAGYVLIDTGGTNSRNALMGMLENAGCKPGSLILIVLTHGDFDHTGNAAFLRRLFTNKIAMHNDDSGMATKGDMFSNRKRPNVILRMLLPIFSGFGKAEYFAPDIFLEDGDDLSAFGIDATIISIPGHSKGSIAILTASGELFCGDLFENIKKPALNSLTDDISAANASIQKLASLKIGMVYPGHGRPFPFHSIVAASASKGTN